MDRTVRLSNGVEIPRLGLGTYQAGGATREAVRHALELGYRHIDTATVYGNEADVGAAIRESGVPRGEVFVTTKLWNDDQRRPARALRESLGKLALDHVDLYLVHWPVPKTRLEAWRVLLELEREGLCRAAGVSNYLPRHLDEIERAGLPAPRVNQIEMHPFLQQREVRARCARAGIVVEAYSPLTRGEKLRDPVVAAIARRQGRTPAQVLVRWALEQDAVVLPKSTRRERIEENRSVFDFALGEEDRRSLEKLEECLHTCWDPGDVP